MLKLMKYEFRKTAFSKLILLCITLIVEVVYLLGIFLKNGDLLFLGVMFLVLCANVGILYIGLESITILQKELNTKQSYMLFLTPRSSYQILGAKILENGISILLTGAFFAVLAVIDIAVGNFKESWDMLINILDMNMSISIDPGAIAYTFFIALAGWITCVVTADLAVILSASVLAGKKGSGAISFIIFIIITVLLSMGMDRIPDMKSDELTFVLNIAAALVVSVILYLISGWVMEKKLSV
nr:hypothetical protein [uncultured Blautia sp.]